MYLKSLSIVMQMKKYPTLLHFVAGCLQIQNYLSSKPSTPLSHLKTKQTTTKAQCLSLQWKRSAGVILGKLYHPERRLRVEGGGLVGRKILGVGGDVGNLNPKVTQNTSPGGRWKGGHSRIEIRNLFREHIPGNFALSKTTFITIIVRMHKGIRLFYGRMLQQRFQTLKVTSTSPNRLGLSGQEDKIMAG